MKDYRALNADKLKLQKKEWHIANRDYVLKHANDWYYANKDTVLVQKKKYALENKDAIKVYMNEYNKKRTKADINYKLAKNLRSRFGNALNNNLKGGSAVRDLGCSMAEFKIHLESQFQEGMTWDNHTRDGWHMDHIRPLSSFDLTDPVQAKQASHYTNLQPMWAKENISKGNKYADI